MSERHAQIETMEHHWMRSWVNGDLKALKAATARNFRLVMGTKPCVILDGKSWFDAAPNRFTCSSYRFGDIYVRDVGSVTVFATQLDLKASIDGHDWSGPVWVTALWKKSKVRRKWKLVERIYSRPEQSEQVAGLLHKLELWRR